MRATTGLAIVSLLLAACAAPGPEPPSAEAAEGLLEALGAGLAGTYVSVHSEEGRRPPIRLEVVASLAAPEQLLLNLTQRQDGAPTRVFRIVLETAADAGLLTGNFVPLRQDGSALSNPCSMRFFLQNEGLIGESDPRNCRFGSGDTAVGLLKEIAFDGTRLRIADQLFDPDGQPIDDPDLLELRRSDRFSGRAAVRDGGGNWRLAADIRVSIGLDLIEPLDAAGMSLGILLNLEYVRPAGSDESLLRLQVLDAGNETVIAQAYAEAGGGRLGLGLDQIRVDLQLEPGP